MTHGLIVSGQQALEQPTQRKDINLVTDASCNDRGTAYGFITSTGDWGIGVHTWEGFPWPRRHINGAELWGLYQSLVVVLEEKQTPGTISAYVDNKSAVSFATRWLAGNEPPERWYKNVLDREQLKVIADAFSTWRGRVKVKWIDKNLDHPLHQTAHNLAGWGLRIGDGRMSAEEVEQRAQSELSSLARA